MKISLIEISTTDTSAIGVRSLSACLKQAGHQVQMIFLGNAGEKRGAYLTFCPDYVVGQIIDLCKQSDVVGCSFLTSGFHRAAQLSESLKKALDTLVIWGGIHATVETAQCLKYADGVCRGEGEAALLELVQRMAAGQDFYDTQNFWFKKNGEIIKNPLRPLIQNLDALPWIDYELAGKNFVLDREEKRFLPLDKSRLFKVITPKSPRHGLGSNPIYTTMTSRGCPRSCAFCFHSIYKQMYPRQRYIRKRSPENIVAELSNFKKSYNFHGIIWFADDDFLAATSDEIREFGELYKQEIGLPFFCLGGPTILTEKKMAYLTNAGLRDFEFGIQTGSTKTKQIFHRPFSSKTIISDTVIINKFKDKIPLPCYDFILDNPWETMEDEIETLNLILQLPTPHQLAPASFRYFPGSVLYEEAKKHGLISIETEQIYCGDFLQLKGSYINFLIALYEYFKIPQGLIKLLSHRTIVRLLNRKFLGIFYKIPFKLHQFIQQFLH